MVKKLRVSLALQPIATALFASSPFTEGRLNGFKSMRSEVWRDTDRRRTGMLPFVFETGMGYERYVDYALDVPMYFVYRARPLHRRLRRLVPGFSRRQAAATAGRAADPRRLVGPPDDAVPRGAAEALPRNARRRQRTAGSASARLPAFWVGLLYDAQALDAAWELVKDWTAEERDALRNAVPKSALGDAVPQHHRAAHRPRGIAHLAPRPARAPAHQRRQPGRGRLPRHPRRGRHFGMYARRSAHRTLRGSMVARHRSCL